MPPTAQHRHMSMNRSLLALLGESALSPAITQRLALSGHGRPRRGRDRVFFEGGLPADAVLAQPRARPRRFPRRAFGRAANGHEPRTARTSGCPRGSSAVIRVSFRRICCRLRDGRDDFAPVLPQLDRALSPLCALGLPRRKAVRRERAFTERCLWLQMVSAIRSVGSTKQIVFERAGLGDAERPAALPSLTLRSATPRADDRR